MSMTRRTFLKGTAGAAACGALASKSGLGAEKWPMRMSASSIMFSRLPVEKACATIAELGFEAVDIWSPHAKCPHLDDVATRLGPDGLKELLSKLSLKLYAFSVYAGGYPKYAELLAKAGGGVAIRGASAPCTPEELVPKMKAFLEALKPEAELAEKHNSYLAIENHGQSLLDSVDSFKAFADLNKHPRVGLALAPYHIQACKQSVEEAIAASGKQLLFFYAWQNAPDTQQLPGIGPTDCAPWLAALAKAGYSWYVNPFMHGEPEPEQAAAALAKSRDYLKECYAKTVQ